MSAGVTWLLKFVFVLLLFHFAIAEAWKPECPASCKCKCTASCDSLTIQCRHGLLEGNTDQLSEQLDSMLSADHIREHLTSLNITGTPLTHVPASVCQLLKLTSLNLTHNKLTSLPNNCFSNLTNLTSFEARDNAIDRLQDGIFDGLVSLQVLDLSRNRISEIGHGAFSGVSDLRRLLLDNNRLAGLPDDCFKNLTKLEQLSATSNSIVTLQDGVFDGLHNLELLQLNDNRIQFIGLKLFSNDSDLTKLGTLDLSDNRLTSLEPWWYARCIKGNELNRVAIVLKNNFISNFTNEMGFDFKCGMKAPYGFVLLDNNTVSRIMDILNGWNIRTFEEMKCLANPKKSGTRMFIQLDQMGIACDCVDHEYAKWIRINQGYDLFRGMQCRRLGAEILADRIPLTNFTCDLTNQCPSSCRCVYRPENITLHIYCSATNHSKLPLRLPPLPKTSARYKLDFSYNKVLRKLDYRPYLKNTTILDVSNCAVDTIDVETWKAIAEMDTVQLQNNQLQSLPEKLSKWNETVKSRLTLSNNPWTCNCDDRWFSRWLKSAGDRIVQPESILCQSPARLRGSSVLQVSEKEFCEDPATTMNALIGMLSGLFGLLIVALCTAALAYRVRFHLHRKFKFHPFDRDECVGENMDFDVFLCCSSGDTSEHGHRILDLLESSGYRVCYHLRDFVAGEPIADNMCQAIQRSKRTVCLVTMNFLKSVHCMREFDMAFHHNVAVKRKKRLIVLMMLDNPLDLYASYPGCGDVTVLRQYVRQYTYIDYTADDWLDRLLYALPLRGLLDANYQFIINNNNDDDDVQLVQSK